MITATAMAVLVPDATSFQSGRQFTAWVRLVPRLNGTGGKVQLGRISKAGDRYLRRLLTLGATSVVHYARRKPERATWINALLARRPTRVVITAVANKLARIIWAVEAFMRARRYPSDLSDAQWAFVLPCIPPVKPGGRPRTTEIRPWHTYGIVSLTDRSRVWMRAKERRTIMPSPTKLAPNFRHHRRMLSRKTRLRRARLIASAGKR